MIRFLPSAAIAALLFLHGPAIADEVKGAAAVKVQDPKRGSIPDLVYAYGTATPTSSATQTASFQRDGQIAEIFVEVGDQFKMGEKLLDFGASPAAVVAYEQAKTTEAIKKRTLERKQQLFKQQLATRDDVDNAEKDLSDAQLTREMYEKIGSVKPSELLLAPFDGVVSAISVSKGDRISAGAPLMTLSRTDQVILSVGVEPSALEKVKPDLPVHLTSLLPGRKPSEGKVKRIGAAIDMKSRQVPVIIELPQGAALSGENFKAGIEVGKFQGWVVPRDSVGSNSKGTFVYQIDEGHAKRVYVKVVGSVGKNSIIEGDIDSQKEMILSGNYQVDDGDAVRPEEAPQEEEEEDN
jgi:membrane fusion protein (multidrug efflux system)